MNTQQLVSFCDELEKISYDLAAAKKVLQVAKPLKLPKRSISQIAGGAAAASGSPIAGLTNAKQSPLSVHLMEAAQNKAVSDLPQHIQVGAREQLAPIQATNRNMVQKLNTALPQGAILRGPVPAQQGINQAFREHLGAAPGKLQSPQQHQMLNSILEGHELDEIKVRSGLGTMEFGHRSPEVLLREHNRVATLPAEYAPVRQYMQNVRAPAEAPALQNVGIQYGQGPRVSRHARRHLTDIMNARTADAIWD